MLPLIQRSCLSLPPSKSTATVRCERRRKIAVEVPRGQNDDGDHGNMTGVDGRTRRESILLQIRVTFGRVHAIWPDVRAEASEVGSYPVYS